MENRNGLCANFTLHNPITLEVGARQVVEQHVEGEAEKRRAQPAPGKAEALRQAQLALLRGDVKPTASGDPGRGVQPITGSIPGQPLFTPDPNAPYAHPYYWAPFILIGNWR